MCRYVRESSRISSGVFVTRSTQSAVRIPNTVIKIPPTSESDRAVCTAFSVSRAFLEPKSCEITTPAPEETPTKKPTMRVRYTAVPPPTAASASFPSNFPIITASIVL